MDKYIFDEINGLWYELQEDYYIPCLILSHIRHSSQIATFCYILLSDFLALVFALISFQGKNKTV